MNKKDLFAEVSYQHAKLLLESDSSALIEEEHEDPLTKKVKTPTIRQPLLDDIADDVSSDKSDEQLAIATKDIEAGPSTPVENHTAPSYAQITYLLIKSALPSLMQGLAANIAFTTLIFFISSKGNVPLIGAVGMGSTLYFTGIIAFLQALNLGLSSLGSQAYGSKNPALLGVYFKRALVIQLIVYIPIAALISQIGFLFKLIGFEPLLANNIQKVLLAMMPAAIPFTYFDAAKNFLISQKIFSPQGYIQLFSSVLDVGMQYFLLVYLDLEILGIGIARFSMESCRAIILYIYIQCSGRCRDSLVPWTRDCFKELWTQFKFQITAGGLQILDLVGTQIILLQAAYFSEDEVAANVVVTRITKFCLIWTMSVGVALSSFVGNAIGEGNTLKTRKFIKMGIIIDCILICLMWLLLGTQSFNLGRIFSDNDNVQANIAGLLLFFMTITPFDNLQNVLGGVLRSIGREKQSTRLYLISYYPIAIPLSIVFSQVCGWRIYGLYASMLVAKGLNTLGSIFFLCRTNLQKQVKFVKDRIKENKKKISTPVLVQSMTQDEKPATLTSLGSGGDKPVTMTTLDSREEERPRFVGSSPEEIKRKLSIEDDMGNRYEKLGNVSTKSDEDS